MASVCTLCGDSFQWFAKTDYLAHLQHFHRIPRPQDYVEAVENLPRDQEEEPTRKLRVTPAITCVANQDIDQNGWEFQVGDLVMAKFDKFPYWPGIVDATLPNKKYGILFFDEKSTTIATVQERFIKRYDEERRVDKTQTGAIARRLNAAMDWAQYVLNWSPQNRYLYFKNPELYQGDDDDDDDSCSDEPGPIETEGTSATARHWQTIRFKCAKCHFTTHLSSVLAKHKKKRNHFTSVKQEMKVVLKPTWFAIPKTA